MQLGFCQAGEVIDPQKSASQTAKKRGAALAELNVAEGIYL
jgi:hypothetical protein